MGRKRELTEQEIDAILAGLAAEGGGDLETFVRALRDAAQEEPSETTAARHLAMIAAESRARVPARRPRRTRRRVLTAVFSTLAAKVALGAVAAAAATGGLAATGSLPGPAQDAVASAFERVGIHMPGAPDDDNGSNDHGETVSGTARETTLTGRDKGQEVAGVARPTNTASKRQDAGHRQDAEHRPDHAGTADEDGAAGGGTGPGGNPGAAKAELKGANGQGAERSAERPTPSTGRGRP